EIAEATAREIAAQGHGAQARAQYPAHKCTMPLEELTDILAAAAARAQGVPAVGALAAARLASLDLQMLAAIEPTLEHTGKRSFRQLAANAHAELTRQAVRRTLQTRRELAVRGHELEAAIDARHGAHGHEAPAAGARNARDQIGERLTR